jgi:hypothetical protein
MAVQPDNQFRVFFEYRVTRGGGHIALSLDGQNNIGQIHRVRYGGIAFVGYILALRHAEKDNAAHGGQKQQRGGDHCGNANYIGYCGSPLSKTRRFPFIFQRFHGKMNVETERPLMEYTLMHKNTPVVDTVIDETGYIMKLLKTHDERHLPVGIVPGSMKSVHDWFASPRHPISPRRHHMGAPADWRRAIRNISLGEKPRSEPVRPILDLPERYRPALGERQLLP